MDGLGVFVFADDGVHFFRSAEEAAEWVEAIDVAAGEYKAFIRLDGERLTPHVFGQAKVVLEASGHRDPEGPVELLERERSTGRFTSDPAQPESVANELLLGDWEARWPKMASLVGQATARRRPSAPLADLNPAMSRIDVSERPLLAAVSAVDLAEERARTRRWIGTALRLP